MSFGQAVTTPWTCLFRLYDDWLTGCGITNGACVLDPELQNVAGAAQRYLTVQHSVVAPFSLSLSRLRLELVFVRAGLR